MGSTHRSHCGGMYFSSVKQANDIDLTWAAFWGFLYPKSFFDMFTP